MPSTPLIVTAAMSGAATSATPADSGVVDVGVCIAPREVLPPPDAYPWLGPEHHEERGLAELAAAHAWPPQLARLYALALDNLQQVCMSPRCMQHS